MKQLLFILFLAITFSVTGQIRHNQLRPLEANTSDSVMFLLPNKMFGYGLLDTTAIIKNNWETYIQGISPNIDLSSYTQFSDLDTLSFLRSYTETDPIYSASSWFNTTNNSGNWNTAFGWGDHSLAGYLTQVDTTASNIIDTNWKTYIGKHSNSYTGGNGIAITNNEVSMDVDGMFLMGGTSIVDGDYMVVYDSSVGEEYKVAMGGAKSYFGGAGAYSGWTLYTDGTNRGTISDGEVVNFAAGTNVTLSYNSTNNTITFNSSSSGGESLWSSDANGINYSVSGKNVGIGASSEVGYVLSVDRSLAGWAGRFRNTNTSGHGLQIVTGNTSGSYNALQLANSQGAIMYMRNAGNMRLHKYGQGSFGGTVAKYLAVDSSGNVIEADGSGAGGWTDMGTDVVLTTTTDRVVIGDDNVNKLEAMYINTSKNHALRVETTDTYGEGLIAKANSYAGTGVYAEGEHRGVYGEATAITGASYGGWFRALDSEGGIGLLVEGARAQFILDLTITPPSSSTDTGAPGEVRVTIDYIYVCVAENTWKRVALSSW